MYCVAIMTIDTPPANTWVAPTGVEYFHVLSGVWPDLCHLKGSSDRQGLLFTQRRSLCEPREKQCRALILLMMTPKKIESSLWLECCPVSPNQH